MPPVVAAAIVTGIAGAGTTAIASRASSSANRRAIEAQERAAARAEAAAKEEDALNRAEVARRDAEDKRRWEVEQANQARKQAQEDALLKDNLARANYEDAIRYGKMVNLARLTGQPIPERMPARTAALDVLSEPATARQASAPIMSRPSSANATIAAPGAFPVSPLSPEQPQRMPISSLVGRRRVI